MTLDSSNIHFKLAYEFVCNTNSSIYLTGKAGTGKTTFLKYVKNNCKKNLVVVAPTGVAAINAGGVTMHSFFQLPFGPFIPEMKTGFGMNEGSVDKNALLKNLKFNQTKRKLIDELQLLIIDEVSMLRSDTLDSINTILQVFRRSKRPFGGVQVLFIGDLYQLPPVVKDEEKILLDKYYESPFFFDAKVLEETTLIYIELKKIYRQNEQHFIDLLNKLRHNSLEDDDYHILNQRYDQNFSGGDKNYITITTHNYKADVINTEELRKLASKQHEFKGLVKGDFGEKQLPTDLVLNLKEGAQVMFVKNDSSVDKKYYNGKIAVISKIKDSNIYVKFSDSSEDFLVAQESWENINYSLNSETNSIEEKIIGEFTQLPLRLAWAITIHKSQGLTFEKAIIDAGLSFAPGQVYVALSRCTSLSGIVLQSRITKQALFTEDRITSFTNKESNEKLLQQQLIHEKSAYQSMKIISLFKWQKILDAMYAFETLNLLTKTIPEQSEAILFSEGLIEKAKEQKNIADKFTLQLETILRESSISQNSSVLKERVEKGISYFIKSLHEEIAKPISQYLKSLEGKSKIRKYIQALIEIESVCWQKIEALQECTLDEQKLYDPSLKISKINIQIKTGKVEKGSSAKETLAYFLSGKSINEIAKIRNMAISTIEGHLAEYVKNGELEILRFLSKEQIDKIKQTYLSTKEKSLNGLKQILQDEFSYAELRMALYHLSNNKEIA